MFHYMKGTHQCILCDLEWAQFLRCSCTDRHPERWYSCQDHRRQGLFGIPERLQVYRKSESIKPSNSFLYSLNSMPLVKEVKQCGMVADWLERSACYAESTDSSLGRDSYCVGTLSKFFAHNCSALQLHLCRQKCTSELGMHKETGRYQRSVVLYCIVIQTKTVSYHTKYKQ